jgi:uncharacterized protein (TIGR02246 family)
MRSLFISSLALLALLSPMMTAAVRAADEQPIKDRIEEFRSAWNKDDTTAMAAVFTDDGTLINPVGVYAQGPAAIEKVFVQEHTGRFKATRYVTSDIKIQWVTPDVAVADVTANISGVHGPDGAAAPDYPHHVTWVLVKKDGKWMTAAVRPYQFNVEPK